MHETGTVVLLVEPAVVLGSIMVRAQFWSHDVQVVYAGLQPDVKEQTTIRLAA